MGVPVTGNAPMYDRQNNMVYSADTNAGEAGLYVPMRQLLDGLGHGRGGQPDLPGFEYHYLRGQCRLLLNLPGPTDSVAVVIIVRAESALGLPQGPSPSATQMRPATFTFSLPIPS